MGEICFAIKALAAANLLEHGVELVVVVHVEGLGRRVRAHALAVVDEAQHVQLDALAFRVGAKDLPEFRALLHLRQRSQQRRTLLL